MWTQISFPLHQRRNSPTHITSNFRRQGVQRMKYLADKRTDHSSRESQDLDGQNRLEAMYPYTNILNFALQVLDTLIIRRLSSIPAFFERHYLFPHLSLILSSPWNAILTVSIHNVEINISFLTKSQITNYLLPAISLDLTSTVQLSIRKQQVHMLRSFRDTIIVENWRSWSM